jgi:hypothetical protein
MLTTGGLLRAPRRPEANGEVEGHSRERTRRASPSPPPPRSGLRRSTRWWHSPQLRRRTDMGRGGPSYPNKTSSRSQCRRPTVPSTSERSRVDSSVAATGEHVRGADPLQDIPSRSKWSSPPPRGPHACAGSPRPAGRPSACSYGASSAGSCSPRDGGETFSHHRSGSLLACHTNESGRAYEARSGGTDWNRDGGRSPSCSTRCPTRWPLSRRRRLRGPRRGVAHASGDGGAGWEPLLLELTGYGLAAVEA